MTQPRSTTTASSAATPHWMVSSRFPRYAPTNIAGPGTGRATPSNRCFACPRPGGHAIRL